MKKKLSNNNSFIKILNSLHGSNTNSQIIFTDSHNYNWNEIYIISCIIAEDLSKIGIKKGDNVAICGDNSINWILALIAIRKIGAYAFLVNPQSTKYEIAKYSEIFNVNYWCIGEAVAANNENNFEGLLLDPDNNIHQIYNISSNINFLNRLKEYDSIKYKWRNIHDPYIPSIMFFTSGTTGIPKGVFLSEHQIMISVINVFNAIKLESPCSTLLRPEKWCK